MIFQLFNNLIYRFGQIPAMGKKEKSQSCSPKGWCKNHLFELRPFGTASYFRKTQKMRFCPKMNKNTKSFLASVPLINKDKKFYTPSFILQEEQDFYDKNDDQMKRSHNERAIDLGEGATKTIMVANNVRKRKYCSVCGRQYADYLEHINESEHKRNINRNRFTFYIQDLQKKYQQSRQKIIPPNSSLDQFTEDCPQKIRIKQREEEIQPKEDAPQNEIMVFDVK